MYRVALFSLILCASSIDAATISHERLDDGTELILITGDIKSGDEATFKQLAIQYDKALVGLSSNGGALIPALDIGTALHLRGFDTAVIAGNQCASACALIWAGGTNRYLVKGGRVGFHASYIDAAGGVVETGLGNALVGRYLTQLGFSERAIIFATATHPNSIAWIGEEKDAELSGFSFNFRIPSDDNVKQTPVAMVAEPKAAGPYKVVQGWSLYRYSDNCLGIAVYKLGNLAVRYDAKPHTTTVAFSYPDGTSLSEGDEKTIAMYLVKQDGSLDSGWKSLKFTTRIIGNKPLLTSPKLLDPAFSDLHSAKTVGFFYNDKLILSFDLKGLGAALDEIKQCSMQVNNLNPRDVFAN
jgi:hypothetical protein